MPNVSKDISVKHKVSKTIIENRDNTLELRYCDADGDGFLNFTIENLQEQVLQLTGLGDDDQEAILISTSGGEIYKINTPSLDPTPELLCDSFGGRSDIAIDENGEMYVCAFGGIAELGADCVENFIFGFPFGSNINSLSFDIQGNMYYGDGTETEVYRYNADEATPPYVWHDFQTGGAGGDFVILNDKMYISWRLSSGNFRLYEITYDTDFNYVSHVDLGQLPNETYGLASELGVLYGVTPNALFKINTTTLTTENIITNVNVSFGDWWGAAGLHEAVVLEASTFLTENDANTVTNPLSGEWTNTISGGQIIYVRIENTLTGEFEIIEVDLNILITPQLTQPDDLVNCSNITGSTFNLTDIEEQLLSNVIQEVNVVYYLSEINAINTVNSLENTFTSLNNNQTIFVRVDNVNDECFNIISFNLLTHQFPDIAPLSTQDEGRFLTNCYINQNDQGYFLLDEIYNDIILSDSDLEIAFFESYEDAYNEINYISPVYFISPGEIRELFVRVTNSFGCTAITNFFLDGDCILTTTNITGLFFPKFITPNDDGANDFWNVKGISERLKRDSVITIYNRYGKLLMVFKPNQSLGWNGLLNGQQLPSSDYWFSFEIKTIGKTFNGHFALVR